MEEPVTDIKFVCSVDNCPDGYSVVTKCPCGHDAQLWEKVIGGEAGTRYVCFAKDKTSDTIIEDLYIPSKSEQYLRRGYHIIKETVEGNSPMYHRQLAVKSVPRSEAKKAIADIIIARSKDKISSIYKKTDKVNGLCICFRTMEYTYVLPPTLAARRSTLTSGEKVQKRFEQTLNYGGGTADGGRDLSKRFEGMRVYDETPEGRTRSVSDVTNKGNQFKVDIASYAPSPPENASVVDNDPLPPYSEKVDPTQHGYKVNLRDYSPSPTFTTEKLAGASGESDSSQVVPSLPPKYPGETTPTVPPTSVVGEVASATTSYSLGAPPPPSSQPHSHPSPYPPLPATTVAASTFNPNPIMQPYSSQQYQPYPPPPSAISPVPPPGAGIGYTSVQPGVYQPQPSQYPTPPTSSLVTEPPPSYNTSIGFQVGGEMGGAPYPPPPHPGYQAVAGNAFGQSGFSSSGSGPAPYNPYQQQPAGGYPPPPPPGSTHGQSTSYGFNF